MKSKLLSIPFDGFYHSISDSIIDDAIEQFFMGKYEPEIPDDFYDEFDGYRNICVNFSRLYVKAFRNRMSELMDHILPMAFIKLTSPKFYNFETDRIWVRVRSQDLDKIRRYYTTAQFKETLTNNLLNPLYAHFVERHQVYSQSSWDHNQLSMIVYAFYEAYKDEFEIYDLMEDLIVNGQINTIVENAIYDCEATRKYMEK